MMWRFFLIILALLILLSLAGYALSLFLKLRRQRSQLEQAKQDRCRKILDSIEVIARAMLQDQCDLSEGVLRLKPLLDVLGKKLSRFPAMWALYQAVETMPIFAERKKLKRNERMRLDLTREAKEAELEPQIKIELRQLLDEVTHLIQELK